MEEETDRVGFLRDDFIIDILSHMPIEEIWDTMRHVSPRFSALVTEHYCNRRVDEESSKGVLLLIMADEERVEKTEMQFLSQFGEVTDLNRSLGSSFEPIGSSGGTLIFRDHISPSSDTFCCGNIITGYLPDFSKLESNVAFHTLQLAHLSEGQSTKIADAIELRFTRDTLRFGWVDLGAGDGEMEWNFLDEEVQFEKVLTSPKALSSSDVVIWCGYEFLINNVRSVIAMSMTNGELFHISIPFSDLEMSLKGSSLSAFKKELLLDSFDFFLLRDFRGGQWEKVRIELHIPEGVTPIFWVTSSKILLQSTQEQSYVIYNHEDDEFVLVDLSGFPRKINMQLLVKWIYKC